MSQSVPPVAPPSAPASSVPSGDLRATILNVTGPLQSVPRTVRVEGAISQINQDGSVTIATSHGDITAILRTAQLPSPGQAVEVDVGAGQPPRQATVRILDPSTQAGAQASGQAGASGEGETPPTAAPSVPQTATAQEAASPAAAPSTQLPAAESAASSAQSSASLPISLSSAVTATISSLEMNSLATASSLPPSTAPGNLPLDEPALDAGPLPSLLPGNEPLPATISPVPGAPAQSVPSDTLIAAMPASLETAAGRMPLQAFPLMPGQPVRLLPLPPGTLVLPRMPDHIAMTLIPPKEADAAPPTPMPSGKTPANPNAAAKPTTTTASPGRSSPSASPQTRSAPAAAVPAGKTPLLSLLRALLRPAGSPADPTRPEPPEGLEADPEAAKTEADAQTSQAGSRPQNQEMDSKSQPAEPGKTQVKTDLPAAPSSKPGAGPTPPLPSKSASIRLDVEIRSIRAAPSGTAEEESLPSAGGETPVDDNTITATVVGFTRQGLPVVSVPTAAVPSGQDFVVQYPASNLAAGMQINVEAEPPVAFNASADAGLSPGQPLAADPLGPTWPALQDLSSALKTISPGALQALGNTLPNPDLPGQIPAAALLYIAAAQSGDAELWLGNKTLDLLRRAGKTDLIARLTDDLDTVGRSSSQPAAQDWKGLQLPFYYDGELYKAMLWHRGDDSGNEKDSQQKARVTRFVFELNLTRMGAVQLDGLANPLRIDLVVRTLQPVGDTMKALMRQKYETVLKKADFTGELSFQDRADQFIRFEARHSGTLKVDG